MTDETMTLIRLINENKSLKEITEFMNLSKKQIFQRISIIRQSGYLVDKKYYSNGDIKYSLQNPFIQKNFNELSIKVPKGKELKKLHIIATSDSHYGHKREDLICLDKMFEYCTKENINLIFHIGDFFEGVNFGTINKQKYSSVYEQINQTLENYPLTDNILTITCLGNHDASFWLDAGIDIKTVLENRRHDIIPIGYGQGKVNIAQNQFILQHEIKRSKVSPNKNYQNKVSFYGHSHKFEANYAGKNLSIHVPSSSKLKEGNFLGIPSILDITFNLSPPTGQILYVNIKHLIFINNKLVKIAEYGIDNKIAEPLKEKETKTLKPNLNTCFPTYRFKKIKLSSNNPKQNKPKQENIKEERKIDEFQPPIPIERLCPKGIVPYPNMLKNENNLTTEEKLQICYLNKEKLLQMKKNNEKPTIKVRKLKKDNIS